MSFFNKEKTGDTCELLPGLNAEETARYRHFRALLDHNRGALTLMSDLEQTYYNNRPFTMQNVERDFNRLLAEVDGMVQSLSGLSSEGFDRLTAILNSLRRNVLEELTPMVRWETDELTLPLDAIEVRHGKDVGNKAANLAVMRRDLGLSTPDGFAITTAAYRLFLQENNLAGFIHETLAEVSAHDPGALEAAGRKIRERIMENPLPEEIHEALATAANKLSGRGASELRLAVRSSAIGEDGEISFAGQYTSVLNVMASELGKAYKQVVASKYSTRAFSYRIHHGLDDRETPMAVLVLEMIEPLLAGVLYTADPVGMDQKTIRVSAMEGLGDALVGGEASPMRSFLMEKNEFKILNREGEGSQEVSSSEGFGDGEEFKPLWEAAIQLEKHFSRPLDIEWAMDAGNRLFMLQVRPLMVVAEPGEQSQETTRDYPGHPILIEGGKCASGGIVAGRVLMMQNPETDSTPSGLDPDTILVSRTASTAMTPWISKVKGVITDMGGVASHLASVAREFGVPALFDTKNATEVLRNGLEITLWASRSRVYGGEVEELTRSIHPVKRPIFASPVHLRMQRLLDSISPLNLTDPDSPQFNQDECRTIHDIIRFCHEISVREMFRFGEVAERISNTVRLRVTIPVSLFAMDLGGGFSSGLTTCDEINAHDVISVPFRSIWKGLTHPGVNWSSTIAVGAHNFMSLMVGGTLPREGRLGGGSYALVSHDYMNLSMRFGYHFATIDALCGEDSEHNYVRLQFAGGAGAYYGRSLRIQYMANVLNRLGFETTLKGDLIEAGLNRLDRGPMEESLDQLGRLLGTSRLLDMALKNAKQVEGLTDDFFQGKYDILEPVREDAPGNFHLITGNWKKKTMDATPMILQDGSDFSSWITAGVSKAMMLVMGKRYQEFLDNIGAYHYFPMAIAKDSHMTDGTARVRVKPLSGIIDQAGGLAFAIRDWGNYFVFRINALEHNAILFEFRNGRRVERVRFDLQVRVQEWHELGVKIQGCNVQAFLENRPLLEYEADRPLDGYVGLWTKADSVILFHGLAFEISAGKTMME
ncbi:MAG: pyruvate, phosphate dikinase [Proteobacteria bacterium]|nr:pyruvate, phosphate dikinase [Pseudomonadota bacterium]